jgi:hypothetical protein
MTKEDFLNLNRIIGQLPPDNIIRKEYLENKFSEYGLSIESGYKAVQYFYSELCKARNNEPTIFKGKVILDNDHFGIVDHLTTCYFKMTIEGFEKRKEVFFPQNMTPIKSDSKESILIDKHLINKAFIDSIPELKIDQIALKYVYEGLQITRENGNDIAKQYGHNSGEKLFQRFTYYSSPANRKGKPTPCTPKKLDNKIKLIESLIEILPSDKQERAKDEVSILKTIYETEYQ